MNRKRGTRLAGALLVVVLAWGSPSAEAMESPNASALTEVSWAGRFLAWAEGWVQEVLGPWAAFAQFDCDHGVHIDPNGGSTCSQAGTGTGEAIEGAGILIDPNG